jgi:hypothetical protein
MANTTRSKHKRWGINRRGIKGSKKEKKKKSRRRWQANRWKLVYGQDCKQSNIIKIQEQITANPSSLGD